MNMVVVFRDSDPAEKNTANKYHLKSLLNQGYKIDRTDSSCGVLVYILTK